MKPKIEESQIILRQWDEQGLTETPHAFNSLEDLYTMCLETVDPKLVDRIVIDGQDHTGARRTVTFVFQYLTVSKH